MIARGSLFDLFARAASGQTLYGGNRESLLRAFFHPEGIPWWIIRKYAARRREYPPLSQTFPHLSIFELLTPAEEASLRARAAPLRGNTLTL